MSMASISPLSIPADIRAQGAKAVSAYAEGLAFEQVLVSKLTEQLSATADASATDGAALGDATPGGGATGPGSGGAFGAGPQAGAYGSLIDTALTNAVMSGGGLGIAGEIAHGLDPALQHWQVSR